MGLLKTAAKAAVASSVHGRVQRRQQARWAEQDRRAGVAQSRHVAPAGEAPTRPPDMHEKLDLLARLGELKDAGVLSDEEFESQKAAILQG